MQLRTFLAADMKAALADVRAEMGDGAVIISSEKTKTGGVSVRVALEEPEADLEAAMAIAEAEPLQDNAPVVNFESAMRDGMLRRLRGDAPTKEDSRHFSRAELLAILHSHRTPDALSHAIAELAGNANLSDMTLALARALDQRMATTPLVLENIEAILLIGPNGAGKTAIAAKLAAHAMLRGREAKLIAGDPSGAGAVPRLQAFADHIGSKFLVADNAEILSNAVVECGLQKSLAIIDTAGFDPRNGKARSAFAALAQIEGVTPIGVISATTDAEDAGEIAHALTLLGAQQAVVTGLDMTKRLGALIAATEHMTLAHVTRSPFVAAGLETLSPLSLSRMLIETAANPDSRSAQ
jgi:flagellar biosynthesis protein FlhF